MKIDGNTIILDAGEEITIKAKESSPEPSPEPTPEPTPSGQTTDRLSFLDLISKFNAVLTSTGHKQITSQTDIYGYFQWLNMFAGREFDNLESEFFSAENYPEVCDYHGTNDTTLNQAYNAMEAWLFAEYLSEVCPDSGTTTNTQTELFKLAFEIGGGKETALYDGYTLRADPNIARLAAARIYAYTRAYECSPERINGFRNELGGKAINASSWDDLGFADTMLTDEYGRRGYQMDCLGYLVNTQSFLPSAAGPRITGCTVCELPYPYEEGQPKSQFNTSSNNYQTDESINDTMVSGWNMMSQTPLSEWNSYPVEKQNRICNAMATIPCTYMYMFGKSQNIHFDGIQYKTYDGTTNANYYCFSKTSENTGLTLDGPFSDLSGIYRYNIQPANQTIVEKYIEAVTDIADNSRFPTQDPNYGRCRPGCAATRQGGEKVAVHGAKENELYNVDIACMVCDDEAGYQKCCHQDGFAQDSPRSYVSGHSAQITLVALLLGQMVPEKIHYYSRRAYDYSVNRSIARFHWNSDCIYGRLFGTMALPIVNAMTGLQSGYEAMKEYVLNPTPQPDGDWSVKLYIKNLTGSPVQSTGEIRLYVQDHIGVNTYLPGAAGSAGALYTFQPGENDFSTLDVYCIMNGETVMDDSYNGSPVTDARFYDQRHWNNIDAGFNFSLDTSDARCDTVLKKSGATYVLKITKI